MEKISANPQRGGYLIIFILFVFIQITIFLTEQVDKYHYHLLYTVILCDTNVKYVDTYTTQK